MMLPPETLTLQALATGNHTRPDNVFASENISELFISCTTSPEKRPTRTDHYPILIDLDIAPRQANEPQKRNFRNVDWIIFNEVLLGKMSDVGDPEEINSSDDLRRRVTDIYQAITAVIEEHVPVTKLCPWTKRWWTKDLEKGRKKVRRLARNAYRQRQDPQHAIHEEYKCARNSYAWDIEHAKLDHWEDYLTELDEANMWSAHRIVSNEPSDQS